MALAAKPLLVIRGEFSDLLSEASMDRMKLAAPSARFTLVSGAGHAPTLGEPEATAAIDAFLDKLEA